MKNLLQLFAWCVVMAACFIFSGMCLFPTASKGVDGRFLLGLAFLLPFVCYSDRLVERPNRCGCLFGILAVFAMTLFLVIPFCLCMIFVAMSWGGNVWAYRISGVTVVIMYLLELIYWGGVLTGVLRKSVIWKLSLVGIVLLGMALGGTAYVSMR